MKQYISKLIFAYSDAIKRAFPDITIALCHFIYIFKNILDSDDLAISIAIFPDLLQVRRQNSIEDLDLAAADFHNQVFNLKVTNSGLPYL